MTQIEALNILISGVVTAYKRQAYEMEEVGKLNEAIQLFTTRPPKEQSIQEKNNEELTSNENNSPYSNN